MFSTEQGIRDTYDFENYEYVVVKEKITLINYVYSYIYRKKLEVLWKIKSRFYEFIKLFIGII